MIIFNFMYKYQLCHKPISVDVDKVVCKNWEYNVSKLKSKGLGYRNRLKLKGFKLNVFEGKCEQKCEFGCGYIVNKVKNPKPSSIPPHQNCGGIIVLLIEEFREMIDSMFIKIKGAKENNLKNIDVDIPKNKLIVFTGLSGSGKSTLALETLQRECQRQYMESMGMTMDIGSKPKVESIEGLSPAISINQHQTNNNPRSTVGTVTEISAYLRVLFAKLGERPCKHCGKMITQSYND